MIRPYLLPSTAALTFASLPLFCSTLAAQDAPARPILRIPVQAVAKQQTESPRLIAPTRSNAVVIKSEEPTSVIKSLTVRQQLPLNSIRANPRIQFGEASLDFKPMLDNPMAPFNVASRLRAMPQAATVVADETTAYEIDQGMVVQSRITYRLQPGTCSDNARRTAVMRAGVPCANRLSDEQLDALFADRQNPRFVADPTQRSKAIAEAQAQRAQLRQQISSDIAELRRSLNDPARRSAIEAKIGAAETARLATLSDDELALEMVNNAETSIEQIVFIPKAETPLSAGAVKALSALNGQGKSEQAGFTLTRAPGFAATAAAINKANPAVDTVRSLPTRIFLTGFTLGREYEWRKRIEKTINWCGWGCKKTYFAELYAGFSYGFGLRFPMQMSGLYSYRMVNGVEKASLTPQYMPINGTAQQYLDAGLANSQVFDGKELVAEARAWAGAGYKLPVGSGSVSFETGKDFTSGLPAPFTNGQFRPPAPGESGLPAMQKVFDDFDLIGGRANFGIVGGQVFPAVKVELKSDSLRFKLNDLVKGTSTTITSTGQQIDLGINPSDKVSRFTLGDPVYNLGFLVTPGLNARLFIDLAVWSGQWDWPVWLPQLAVQLPPGGVDFACHADTVCSRSYIVSPTRQSEAEGPTSAVELELEQWAFGFDNKWLPQCPDKKCEVAIKIVRQGTIFNVKKLAAEKDAASDPDVAKQKNLLMFKAYLDAHNEAAGLIEEAKQRVAKGNS